MKIKIETIPHDDQRYNTIGDWIPTKEGMDIKVSKLCNQDYEFLIVLHELIEGYICMKRGISDADVTKFDMYWKGHGEPGDSKAAPYHREHKLATSIEKRISKELGVNWFEYEKTLDNLSM